MTTIRLLDRSCFARLEPLLWLIIVSIALEEAQDLSALNIAAVVLTGAGLWTLLVGRGHSWRGAQRSSVDIGPYALAAKHSTKRRSFE